MQRVLLSIAIIIVFCISGCKYDVNTISSSSADLPTSALGVRTFDDVVSDFKKNIAKEGQNDLSAYSDMPEEDMAWLLKGDVPLEITESSGFVFENGDIIILFMLSPTLSMEETGASEKELHKQAQTNYSHNNKDMWIYINGDFGFIINSKDYSGILGQLAINARQV